VLFQRKKKKEKRRKKEEEEEEEEEKDMASCHMDFLLQSSTSLKLI
jgi:hypothetical protein